LEWVCTDRMPFILPNQWHERTEGNFKHISKHIEWVQMKETSAAPAHWWQNQSLILLSCHFTSVLKHPTSTDKSCAPYTEVICYSYNQQRNDNTQATVNVALKDTWLLLVLIYDEKVREALRNSLQSNLFQIETTPVIDLGIRNAFLQLLAEFVCSLSTTVINKMLLSSTLIRINCLLATETFKN